MSDTSGTRSPTERLVRVRSSPSSPPTDATGRISEAFSADRRHADDTPDESTGREKELSAVSRLVMVFARFSFSNEAPATTTTTIIERPLGMSTSMLDLRSSDGDFEMVTVHGKPAWTRQNHHRLHHYRLSNTSQPQFRVKSYSETGPVLERMVQTKARPYSAGTAEDIRRVCISGFSKNRAGTWMFKVDIGSDVFDSYAVRRRFSDFKELYLGLQELGLADQLPELPHHGVFSVMQIFFSPEPALSHRARKLEEILQFVNNHPVLCASAPFTRFIGKNPSSLEVGYVSLSGSVTVGSATCGDSAHELREIFIPNSKAEAKCNIFVSPNYASCPKLCVFLQPGDGMQPGVWSRQIHPKTGFQGSMLPYLKTAVQGGYGVVVLNPSTNYCLVNGHRAKVLHSSTPEDHVAYVWKNYIMPNAAQEISFIVYDSADTKLAEYSARMEAMRQRELAKEAEKKPMSIEDFDLMKVVGRGAFGKVLLVRKKEGKNSGHIYAMKILVKAHIIKNDQVENTKAEQHILKEINHPFIVRLRYAFQNADKLYLVMDYYPGGSMFYHLRKSKRFTEERTRLYMAQLLTALMHLHSKQIAYRDLKLENILMDPQGNIALTDFGLSKEGQTIEGV
ncbi:hypothetical protein P43SY_005058 [Pythium insidiosum]|uniref:AGC protein kinase n=1 Tax=Pythium insidiosum TaxID=114742 RepID=A0AAD5LPR7_PYTIN|nr:hypothetical protein P43SY_005058 [Pythium insidiosum]